MIDGKRFDIGQEDEYMQLLNLNMEENKAGRINLIKGLVI